MVLESDNFPKFFDLVEVANFEIASDAFSSFKVGAAASGLELPLSGVCFLP